jgi:hypothetical protein
MMYVKRHGAMAVLVLAACAESGTGPERNEAPLAVVASDGVEAGTNRTVTLDAASSIDPDGDEPQFTWTQVAGPDVGPLTGPRPSFTAPDAVSTLRFELVVSDGQAQSNTVRLTVWVIARQNGAVWVSPAGSDDSPGTREEPMATIQAAIDAAAGRNSDVYIAEGTWNESVTARRDVSLYGGYRTGSWLREVGSARSRLIGASPALSILNAGDVTVDGLEIESADATGAGLSSVAVLISNTRARVYDSVLRAGAGASGRNGVAGGAGGNGPSGSNGASQGSCFSSHPGGNGGNAVYDGGKGGSGGAFGGSNGSGGQGPAGGSAGKGGAFSASRINAGASGGSGGNGGSGGSGSGGNGFGSLEGAEYLPASGSTGGSGASGSGGGGGGGGMGQSVVCGAGGGGGGAGGYGGRHRRGCRPPAPRRWLSWLSPDSAQARRGSGAPRHRAWRPGSRPGGVRRPASSRG